MNERMLPNPTLVSGNESPATPTTKEGEITTFFLKKSAKSV